MANKIIKDLTTLASGNIEGADWLEVQEDDANVTKKVTVTVLTELEAAARAAQDNVIEAAVGLDTDGTYPGFSGSNYLDASTDVMDALDKLDTAIGDSDFVIQVASIEVSAANLNNAGVAPFEIVAAPGANHYIEVLSCSIYLNYASTRVECSTQKLVLEYDTGSNHFMEWSNSFIENNADTANKGTWTSEVEMIENKKIQLTFDGGVNPTAGDSTLLVWITYIDRDLTK